MCRPRWYINRESCLSTTFENQSESTSGRHSRVDLGGISTAISNVKSSLAQLNITSALYQPRSKREHIWCSGISIEIRKKTNVLLDDTTVSTRAVYQPRSAKGKHIWRSCIDQQQSARQVPLRHRPADLCNKTSTSGQHSRVDQSGISTAISKAYTSSY